MEPAQLRHLVSQVAGLQMHATTPSKTMMRMLVESNNSIAIDNPASVDKGSQLLHCDGDKIL